MKINPLLLIFQFIELSGCVYFLSIGRYWIAAGCILALLAFTLPVWASMQPDRKTDINGEITAGLYSFSSRRADEAWRIKRGNGTWKNIDAIKKEEAEFRKRIEIDPHDHRTLYRWKK